MAVTIEIVRDPVALAGRGADLFVSAAQSAVAARGAFYVALSGGNTPRGMYEVLAHKHAGMRMPWPRVHLYWGDERCVPPDHPDSNYGAARAALIGHVPVPPENVHRMRGEEEPDAAARAYEAELRRLPLVPPVFDLVLLGLGGDGHTASLFPRTAALDERERFCVPNTAPDGSPRLTMTYPVFVAARKVVFLVGGGGKAGVVAGVLEGERRPADLPAQRVDPRSGELVWLLDEAAASGLAPATLAAAHRP